MFWLVGMLVQIYRETVSRLATPSIPKYQDLGPPNSRLKSHQAATNFIARFRSW